MNNQTTLAWQKGTGILSTAMVKDKALAAQVRRLGEHLSNDANKDDKWAAYLYNTARTLEQRKYEEYLRTQEGMLRCKPWTRHYTNKYPHDDDHAGGSNVHMYTILDKNEPNPETEEDSEPCPELTNEPTSRGAQQEECNTGR